MKKKIIAGIIVCIFAVALIVGIRLYQREQDPYWQVAKKIYNVQTALQAEDEDWKLESLSKVDPFTYRYADGTELNYYCCTTSYLNEEPIELTGLNKTALDQVVDIDAMEDCRDCEVNGKAAVIGKMDGLTYLCWTISPKYSCVIAYTSGMVAEDDVFRMAESVQIQEG